MAASGSRVYWLTRYCARSKRLVSPAYDRHSATRKGTRDARRELARGGLLEESDKPQSGIQLPSSNASHLRVTRFVTPVAELKSIYSANAVRVM